MSIPLCSAALVVTSGNCCPGTTNFAGLATILGIDEDTVRRLLSDRVDAR